MDRIGVVVNPIAGMGGRVGLKGTDGVLEEAIRRGATPRAPRRAVEALETLHRLRPDLTVYAGDGVLGADQARAAGYDPIVVAGPIEGDDGASNESARFVDATESDRSVPRTTAVDTKRVVRAFLNRDVDLVLFVGGDGTAADVAIVLADADVDTPMLGVPAGVKIYSSVFGVTPADAGRVAATFERIEAREVNDIDEEAYRAGEVRTKLEAVVPVPVADEVQPGKHRSSGTVETLAEGFARDVVAGTTYVFGPGSTVGAIEDALGIDASPLGVDVWWADDVTGNSPVGTLVARDAPERKILDAIEDAAHVVIVVSPIGGQGFVFGRGNQQLSPDVVRRSDEVEIVASEAKLDHLDVLRVDTDDETLNESLRGWIRVRTGRYLTRLVKVV